MFRNTWPLHLDGSVLNMRIRELFLAFVVLSAADVTALRAQLPELQLGIFGGQGVEGGYRNGFGGTAGVMIAQRFFVGGRYIRHWGGTDQFTPDTNIRRVDRDANIVTAELGVQLFSAGIEIRGTANFGAAAFTEETSLETVSGTVLTASEAAKTEFLVSPGVIVTLPLGRFKVGGELHYFLFGDPELNPDVDNRSFVFYGRLVYPISIR